MLFPTQIIVTKELDEESHRWLKSLSGKLKKHEMVALLRQIETLEQKFERELADAVLEVSIRANPQIVEELKGEGAMCQALLEIMEPEINQIVMQATEKERREKEEAIRQLREEAEKSAIKMIKLQKFTIEEIQECIPKLSADDIRRLVQNVAQGKL